jgi:hypothetical protein
MNNQVDNKARILSERRLLINDYFDDIKNKIDIRYIEISKGLNEQRTQELNKLYESFIHEIDAIKQFNLDRLEDTQNCLADDDSKKNLFTKFCFIFDFSDFKFQFTRSNLLKMKLVVSDCYVNENFIHIND